MRMARPRSRILIPTLASVLALIGALIVQPVRAQTAQDTIQNFSFHPDPLTVTVGTTVTWTNQDTAPHTSTSDPSSTFKWDTGTLAQGKSGSVTFTQAGTFTYHCSVHPNMHGTIVVQAAGSGSGSGSVPLAAQPVKSIVAKERNNKYIFGPARTTISIGTRVWWLNKSDAPHTVTSTTTGWTFNKKLSTNKVSFVFNKAGTYRYHCIYHAGMVGTIIVK